MQKRKEKETEKNIENHQNKMTDRNNRKKKIQSNQKAKEKMEVLSSRLSLISLNADGLNSPIKK